VYAEQRPKDFDYMSIFLYAIRSRFKRTILDLRKAKPNRHMCLCKLEFEISKFGRTKFLVPVKLNNSMPKNNRKNTRRTKYN